MATHLLRRVSHESWTCRKRCLPVGHIPNPHTGIQTASRDSSTIKSHCVDLTEVALQCSETAAFADTPYPSSGVIAARHNKITMYFETSYTGLMAHKNVLANSAFDVPDTKSGVSRAGYRCSRIAHFEAADSRGVTSEHVECLAAGCRMISTSLEY